MKTFSFHLFDRSTPLIQLANNTLCSRLQVRSWRVKQVRMKASANIMDKQGKPKGVSGLIYEWPTASSFEGMEKV